MIGKRLLVVAIMGMMVLGTVLMAVAQEEKKAEEPTYEYIGAKKCKMCHNKESSGAQFTKWSEGPHAAAVERLATDEAKAKAKEMGLGNPQEEEACLKCHATAFAVMGQEDAKITMEEGVSCEGCHGPGSAYKSKKTMEGITAGEIEPASVGLVVPTEETCVGCHNEENPFHKEFKVEEYMKKIAHPIPKGE